MSLFSKRLNGQCISIFSTSDMQLNICIAFSFRSKRGAVFYSARDRRLSFDGKRSKQSRIWNKPGLFIQNLAIYTNFYLVITPKSKTQIPLLIFKSSTFLHLANPCDVGRSEFVTPLCSHNANKGARSRMTMITQCE